jgi:uncharacterized protein YbjT (DUF2867 family)
LSQEPPGIGADLAGVDRSVIALWLGHESVLRNGWFTENYSTSAPGAVAGGAFLGSASNGKISSAARVDYADAAVAVLTSEGAQG